MRRVRHDFIGFIINELLYIYGQIVNWIIHPIDNMIDKRLIVVAVVIIVVVAAAGIYLAVGGEEDSDTVSSDTTRLQVYGNANNDDYLNDDDVELIQSIADSGSWDQELYPYADANVDGVVDENDVTYLENLLNGGSGLMYYTNSWGDPSYVHYPITGGIGTMYWQQADLAILLGLWDRVTACGSGSMNDIKNPGWEDRYSLGLGYNVEPEVVFSAPISALIAYVQSDGSALDLVDAVEESGSDLDIVCLPHDRITAVLTAGVLFGCEERSELYRQYYDEVMDYVDEVVGDLGDDAPTVMTIQMRSTTDLGNIEVYGPAYESVPNGLYSFMELSPCIVIYPEDYVDFYTEVDIEWIISMDPDYIIFTSSGLWNNTDDLETIEASFLETCEKFFSQTSAYENGNIIATANGTMNSYMGCFAYLSILQYIFPQIDRDYAAEIYNEFFVNDFAYYDLDNTPTYRIYSLSNYQ